MEMLDCQFGDNNQRILKDIENQIEKYPAYKLFEVTIRGDSKVNNNVVYSFFNNKFPRKMKIYSDSSLENAYNDNAPSTVVVSIKYIPEYSCQFNKKYWEREPYELSLLDYLYFTIYTITTTGYGDIFPVTGYAKFIASLANLFELFFMLKFSKNSSCKNRHLAYFLLCGFFHRSSNIPINNN
jgi:hypothetical protein